MTRDSLWDAHLAGSPWGLHGVVLGQLGPLVPSPPLPTVQPAPKASPGFWEDLRREGRAVTFPGRATGPEDSLPFGAEGLGDPEPSWGHREPF